MNQLIPSALLPHPEWVTLYQRLQDFQVQSYESVPLAFLSRLARQNSWTSEYAERVFVEYKRFLFMTVVADHAVSPCEALDQVWHFHLSYTRSYWDDLCGEILGNPLHHVPSRGVEEERNTFYHDYEKTLASYERLFGEKPPVDIWEKPEERLQVTPHLRLVDARSYWRIPRLFRYPKLLVVTLIGMGVLILVTLGIIQVPDFRVLPLEA